MSNVENIFKQLLVDQPVLVGLAGAAAFKAAVESYDNDFPPEILDFKSRWDAALADLKDTLDSLDLEDR